MNRLLSLIDEMAQIFNDETIDEPELESLVDSVMPELFDKLNLGVRVKVLDKIKNSIMKEEADIYVFQKNKIREEYINGK